MHQRIHPQLPQTQLQWEAWCCYVNKNGAGVCLRLFSCVSKTEYCCLKGEDKITCQVRESTWSLLFPSSTTLIFPSLRRPLKSPGQLSEQWSLGCLSRLGLDLGLVPAPQQSAALGTGAAASTDARVTPARDGAMASSCILPAPREHQLCPPSSKTGSKVCTVSLNGCYVEAPSRHTIYRGFKITSVMCCTQIGHIRPFSRKSATL